ncbi:hypothetical protein FRC09_017620 [Ceratobasidium sp. 395]|nr:hypothetical protein FRC09_017620 [Ceratobasidium sp. 395]
MSNPLPPKKKQRIAPSCPPRASTGVTAASRVDHARSQSVPNVASSIVVPSTQVVRAFSAYPTPAQTVRKATNEPKATDSGAKPALPAPNFEAENEEKRAAGDASSDEYEDSGDSEDGEQVRKGREGEDDEIELVIHVPAHLKTQDEINKYVAKVQAEYSKTGKLPSKPKKQVPAPAKPVVSQSAPGRLSKGKAREVLKVKEEDVKMEEKEVGVKVEEDVKMKVEPSEMTDAQRNVVRNYTLKCFLSTCGLNHAHEAGSIVSRYDELTGDPIHKVEKQLIPHFDWSFKENFDNGWHRFFYKVVRGPSRLRTNKDFLASAPLEFFRRTLETGAFATMQGAWNRNKEGKGKEARVKESDLAPRAPEEYDNRKLNAAARPSTSPNSTVHILERWSIRQTSRPSSQTRTTRLFASCRSRRIVRRRIKWATEAEEAEAAEAVMMVEVVEAAKLVERKNDKASGSKKKSGRKGKKGESSVTVGSRRRLPFHPKWARICRS